MANEKNLIPLTQRGKEEAKKIRQKGQKAQKEAQRRRKTLRESMNALLDLPISNQRDFNKVVKMGIPMEDIDNSQLIVLALFNQAKLGDVAAIKELRNLIGEEESRDTGQLDDLIRGLKEDTDG